jgi:aminodeoxyfutalosine deaminase
MPSADLSNPRLTLKARYVFPVAGPPIADGAVTIEGPRIVAVGETADQGDVRDLGNVAILPGLVNAHVHLNFSDLAEPLGAPGIAMGDWLRLAIERNISSRGPTSAGIALGLQESLRHGVTTLGDIAQAGWPIEQLSSWPLNLTLFQELIAPTGDRVAAAIELARSHLRNNDFKNSRELTTSGKHWQPGLSPHAPYTVHPNLLTAVVELSAAEQVPVAMHLAESREELELLRHGVGPLRTLLEEVGAWDPSAIPPKSRPLDYLRTLAGAAGLSNSAPVLIVHGNYLDDEEIAFLGANAARMTVVYCPRSHRWFGRDAYPLEKMLAAGVTVALGTDGRGSAPDLSVLAEMRLVAQRHPAVAGNRIMQMGTILSARALGWPTWIGSLEPGKQADLAIVGLPSRDAADPHALLFDSTEPVVGCYLRGSAVHVPG